MATALYRRYRPESFSEMIGQEQVTEPLRVALRSSKLGHAYLFSGPRGCGKTTSARILARCLNCHEGPTDTPCGTCPSCLDLGRDGGGSLDVIEIDAASHGGVEDARELRERAVFAPARDKYKVFIIDEAHMVSREGFNALLKIVEEPPEHVKFVFATTEPEKVLGTIRSRTHHYPFRLVAPLPLTEYIKDICVAENVETEDGVLGLAVRAGGGSVRDTLSILDQLIAGSENNRLSYSTAVGLLGYTPEDLLDETVFAFGARDAQQVMTQIDSVIQSGQDPRRFVEDLLERLRDLIVVQATSVSGASSILRDASDEQLQRLFEQTNSFSQRELSVTADIVSETLEKMVGATAPKLQLELMAAKILVQYDNEPLPEPRPEPQQVSRPEPRQDPRRQNSNKPSYGVTQAAPVDKNSRAPEKPSQQSAAETQKSEQPISFADAASAARAFLRGDTAQQPASQSPDSLQDKNDAENTKTEDTEVVFTLDQLKTDWAKVRQFVLDNHGGALESINQVRLADFRNNHLFVEYKTPSGLESFKNLGAGALREAIKHFYGIDFSYMPQAAPGVPDLSTEQESPVEPLHTSEPEPPLAPESQLAPEPPLDPEPQPVTATENATDAFADPEPPLEQDLEDGSGGPYEDGYSEEPSETGQPQRVTQEQGEQAPEIVRYGESVVRAQLGAKLIKEIPLGSAEENPGSVNSAKEIPVKDTE